MSALSELDRKFIIRAAELCEKALVDKHAVIADGCSKAAAAICVRRAEEMSGVAFRIVSEAQGQTP